MNLPVPVSSVVVAVGWGLISFLWQALLIHGALLLALRLVPVGRSSVRYTLGLVALAALVLAPVATVSRFVTDPVPVPMTFTGLIQVPAPAVSDTPSTGSAGNGVWHSVASVIALGWPVNVQVLMGYLSR